MEIRHLKLLDALDRLGSLTRAAQELQLTPSALSHQLRQLEKSIATKVVRRTAQQLYLTPVGRELLVSAREILTALREMEERIARTQTSPLVNYVHGYSPEEVRRLYDQATSVASFIHWDSHWEAGASVLEAGCGVGAQTRIIAAQNPAVAFTAVDWSEDSLAEAAGQAGLAELNNVKFRHADLRALPFSGGYFDHVFVCFVLEHLAQPAAVLKELLRVLKPGGTITVVEGDHGSTYFHPDSAAAHAAVAAQVALQRKNNGDANIGRTLYPLLVAAGCQDVKNTPRTIYVDASNPELVDGFVRKTFIAMIEGIAEEAVAQGLIPPHRMEQGLQDLHRTTAADGTFSYTFYKASGRKPLSSSRQSTEDGR